MKKKFRFEAASDTEAAFIFCEYNPIMKAKVIEFRTHSEMDAYATDNLTIQVKRQLPILLELIDAEDVKVDLIKVNFNRMAEWYYYSVLRK